MKACEGTAERVERVLDGAADAEALRGLAEHVRGCPGCRSEHGAALRALQVLQDATYRRPRHVEPSPGFEGRVMARVRQEAQASRARAAAPEAPRPAPGLLETLAGFLVPETPGTFGRGLVFGGALAACAAILLWPQTVGRRADVVLETASAGPSVPAPAVLARLTSIGDVSVRRAGSERWGPASRVHAGRPGDRFRVSGSPGGAVLELPGETRVFLGPGSELVLADGSTLDLSRGHAAVSAGAPMSLRTRHGRVDVLGTRFVVETGPEVTSVAVEEGRVRVTSATSGLVRLLSSGDRARVGAGGFLPDGAAASAGVAAAAARDAGRTAPDRSAAQTRPALSGASGDGPRTDGSAGDVHNVEEGF